MATLSKKDKWILTFGHLLPTWILSSLLMVLSRVWYLNKPGYAVMGGKTLFILELVMYFVVIFSPVLGLQVYKNYFAKKGRLTESLAEAVTFNLLARVGFILAEIVLLSIWYGYMYLYSSPPSKLLLFIVGFLTSIPVTALLIFPVFAVARIWLNKPFEYPLTGEGMK